MIALFKCNQSSERWRSWTFEQISEGSARLRLDAGDVDQIVRMDEGELRVVGYREKRPVRVSRPSPATLTESTMDAVTNDADLTGWERRERVRFGVWAIIGESFHGQRAVAVRPRITDAERREAMRLLRAA